MEKRPQKILVVDDTEATRYAVARTLQKNGFDVIEAATGQQALDMVQSELPDLVTLDIHLPDILGFEVCKRIKKNPETSFIPVLQVSASYVTSKDRIHGLEGGADSYLTHPFEPPVLVATVKALLRGQELNEKLRKSEEHFRVALKNAPIMIYTCDTRLGFTWVHNPPAPLTSQDFIGKKDDEVFDAAFASEMRELKNQVLSSGVGLRALKQARFHGKELSYDLTMEPLLDSAGRIKGLTVSCIDVTERLKAEIATRKAMEEAEFANHAKTRFLSNMSHEIRTPLGVIQGFAELALDEDITLEDRQDYLQTIKRNANELTKLIGEILDLAKIEAGHSEAEIIQFPLKTVAEDIISALSLQAKEKGIGLGLEFSENFPTEVKSDPTRVRQVLVNLISNAIKFTPRGGVMVRASVEKRDAANKAVIAIDVSDTGIGLSPDQRGRLFQAFSQADSSTTRKYGGTGLGLDLSRRLSQSLGGTVDLMESEIGVGSKFRFTFDAIIVEDADKVPDENKNSEVPAKERFEGRLRGLRVLLVDDSTDNLRLFSKYLNQTGALVTVASGGGEAIELGQKKQWDVILMDVQMPNIDGHQATAELRHRNVTTPIIAVTANALKEEREKALEEGFNGYLIKPLEPKSLVECLEKYRTATDS